jgi:protoporphyrinogen/coproporphyrinogen III oxidase
MSTEQHVVVVGAGISGLTTAFWLRQSGIAVTVLEQDVVPGGTMRTRHEEGWLIETGPNSALETTPVFGEMFGLLGIAGERQYASESSNNRYILRNGVLHSLPMSPLAFLKSRLWTTPAKFRLLAEPFIGRGTREETIAEFVERRLGREFLDYAINPFVAGVFAGSPEHLSVRAAFPKLYALEEKYGGLINGMIKGARERKQRTEVAKDRAKMFAFKNGMQTFPDAIVRSLELAVQCGCAVGRIARTHGGTFRVGCTLSGKTIDLEADAVVLSTPAYAAAPILHPLAPKLANMLSSIYYPPVAEVFLGFREEQCPRPLDGFGYLIPAKEQRKILGTIWSSAIFPDRAPAGHIALTSFVGGSRQPELLELDDAGLLSVVTAELGSLMGMRGEPVFTRIIRWDRAIPQYNLGYHHVVEAIEDLEREVPGLYLCSNFRGGIAVGDCVKNGKATAGRIAAALARA